MSAHSNRRPSRSERTEQVRQACDVRGIQIEQRGQSFRLRGPGVDLSVAALWSVDTRDLKAPRERTED